MLEAETKRRIDTARDVLVGKVPDPKSQVEQITIALIYKFMDDMDKESISMGGNPSFFVGEYEKYSWTKIFNPRLGGYEMLSLYSEAITRLSQNPNLPSLFRDIFKNAYLPYRDPETLKLFLKTINEFVYDHSERLGDAYEYLLAVLGSQGDAGQFLTPRHLIDFMVRVVGPKKDEVILDPACGTAGFLISAYRHILQANTDKTPGDLFTIDERKRLANNIKGYDIAPDMVRLSLVNMYLHGFTNPQISEYDTLTSEEKWGEYADVILANPPFMTPKGGIKPHKRFSVQSNRSEVLFVDYIAEHLTPNGRAAVIVPEGVIFQSGKAYKQLRKEVIEKSLWAVVSLPAGVFNPYSGVKTSILFMDKQLAKKSDSILFIRICNDGYGLGAQRKEIGKNDLPEAISELTKFSQAVNSGNMSAYSLDESSMGYLLVKKDALTKGGEYNLSAERYRDSSIIKRSKYPMKRLEEISLSIGNGVNVNQQDREGKYRVTRIQTISDGTVNLDKTLWTNDEPKVEYLMEAGDILFSHINSYDHLAKTAIFPIVDAPVVHGINLIRIRLNKNVALPEYVIQCLKTEVFKNSAKLFAQKAVNQASIKVSDIKRLEIPLPPLEIQKEIAAEIEEYQRIIDGARQVVENWKPRIDIDPEWPLAKIEDVCTINPRKQIPQELSLGSEVSFIPMEDIGFGEDIIPKRTRALGEVYKGYSHFKESDILLAKVTPCFENGKIGIARNLKNGLGFGSTELHIIRTSEKIIPEFLLPFLITTTFKSIGKEKLTGTGGLKRLPASYIETLMVPIPRTELQLSITKDLKAEETRVKGAKELIDIYKSKIESSVARMW